MPERPPEPPGRNTTPEPELSADARDAHDTVPRTPSRGEETHPSPEASSSRTVPGLPARLGAYNIVSILGEGGMGRVYLGEDPQLGGHVADSGDPEAALLRKIGRRRIAVLRSGISNFG